MFQEKSVLVMWSLYDQIQVGVYLYCQYIISDGQVVDSLYSLHL